MLIYILIDNAKSTCTTVRNKNGIHLSAPKLIVINRHVNARCRENELFKSAYLHDLDDRSRKLCN